MKRIRLFTGMLLSLFLISGMTGCGQQTVKESTSNESIDEETKTTVSETSKEAEPADSGKDTLVVYFSATGTTKGVAEKIASVTGADLYEIVPAEQYSEADLDWNDKNSRTTKEQNDASARPAVGSEKVSLDGYKTIYIGYPIWWGEEPRIMDTFVETYDFSGKTLIPFCTSGSSGIGRSGKNLEEKTGSGTWLDGERLKADISEDDIRSWISGFKEVS